MKKPKQHNVQTTKTNGAAPDVPVTVPEVKLPETPATEATGQLTDGVSLCDLENQPPTPATTDTPAPAAADAPKPRIYNLKLNVHQLEFIGSLVGLFIFGERVTKENDNAIAAEVEGLLDRAEKSTAGTGVDGSQVIFGHSITSMLNWMGARGFSSFDAKQALAHYLGEDVEIEKSTISRALAKGGATAKGTDKGKKINLITLAPEQVVDILQFKDIAAKQAAKLAEAEMAAAVALLAPKPADEPPAVPQVS